MNSFLEKSTQSLKSAEFLINQSHYTCSVNRSYYASLQYIFHILFEKLGQDKDKFYRDVQDETTGGTHSRALLLIRNELRTKSSSEYKTFNSTFPSLKKRRNIADYKTDILISDQGREALNEANRIIRCLNNSFK